MKATNAVIPTRLKKYNYNWYTVAAVATALQMSVDNEVEAKALAKGKCIDVKDFFTTGSVPSTSTVLVFDNKNFEASVSTVLSAAGIEDQDDFTDVAIKPRYVKEFKIKVATLKIDKSLPKIFVD